MGFDVDFDLLARLKAKDSEAWRDFIAHYSDKVYRWAYRILRHRTDAEDVTVMVFGILSSKIDSFKGESGLDTWLYRIVFNLAITEQKKRAGRRASCLLESVPDRRLDPANEIEAEEYFKWALRKLGPELKAVWMLVEVDGLSYSNAAKQLGIPVTTLTNRLYKARQRLRAIGDGENVA